MRRSLQLVVGVAGALLLSVAPATAAVPDVDSSALGPDVGGYVLRGVDDTIAATFTVPRWACGAEDDGVTTLVTALGRRKEIGGAGVETACIDGHKVIRAGFMTPLGGFEQLDEVVRGGDQIRVEVIIQGEDLIITVRNLTRQWGVGTGQPDAGGDLAAAVVGDARLSIDGQVLPIPAFGRHQVTGLLLDGAAPEPSQANRKVLVDGAGNVLIKPSRLRDGATAFTLRSTT